MKEIIKNTKCKKIPPRPEVPIPERTNMGILGQINHQVSTLYDKAASTASDFDKVSIENWKSNEEKGKGSMHQLLQNPDPSRVDESLFESRIEYLSEFELDDENEEGENKDLSWCSGIVERVCDGAWIKSKKRRQCYKKGKGAEVFWDAIHECNMEASRSIETFHSRLWNKKRN